MRDPYSILGVGRHAGQQEIKAAWRATAKALHPDQNPDDPTAASRFTEAGRAYDLLKDPNKRKLFDDARARAEAGRGGKEKTFMEQRADRARAEAEARAAAEARAKAEARAAAAAAAAAAATKGDASDAEKRDAAEDVVAKIFGTRKSSDAKAETKAETKESAAPPPPPQEPKASKPADEPAQSAEKAPEQSATHDPRPSPALELITYVIKRLTRSAPPPDKAPDLMIDVPVSIEDILKRINPAVTLPDGKLMSVTIPDDAKDGTQIRIEGQGHRLPNVKRGDVIATLRVKPHSWYRHYGYDLLTYVDIDMENAVLGCEATVETPDGPMKVTIPPWSGSNFKATVPGRGLPKGNGARGDLIAEVRVLLWDRPDQKVIDLMRSLREGLYL